MTTNQSASLAIDGEVKRGNPYSEPKAPLTCGGDAPTDRSEFFTRLLFAACAAIATLLWLPPAAADCEKSSNMRTLDEHAIPIYFGRVNLASTYLQPPGSLMASTVVPSSEHFHLMPDTVLWHCDRADLPNLKFLVATNGDSRFGGHNDVGGTDGVADVYATWFEEAGLRLTMAGVPLTRYWRAVPVSSYHAYTEYGKRYIDIRLKDIPPLHAELVRVSNRDPKKGANLCTTTGRNANAEGRRYECAQPNGYLQLTGYGSGLDQDKEGADSNTSYKFWSKNNGVGYRMYQNAFLVARPSCAVRRAPAHVTFAAVSAERLNSGHGVTVPFGVQIECQNTAPSGTGKNQVSIGIQVSPGAWRAAQALKLVNKQGGVSELVSDQTGLDATLATGVGITLTDKLGGRVNFVGQLNDEPGGNPASAGWYPVRYGSKKTGPSGSQHTLYERQYTATLARLPGKTATAGRIHATASVVVKVQ